MTLTDPIADMLTRIRNATMIKKKEVDIPSSHMKVEIARVMKDEGYIKNFRVIDDKLQGILKVYIKYTKNNVSVISGLKKISKPGCRIYCKRGSIPKVIGGLGIVIVSTSQGILTGRRCEELGIGGEVLSHIW
ncbi:MAG: 30S ribosomal protein S8 [Acidobacteriota bacterium]|nr:30S ribosomal protein S8 [Acidobacteriota bacterium]